MTAGYDRHDGGVDRFRENHRVTRFVLARDGRDVAAFELDPDARGLQRFAVDLPGGSFELRITGVVPGQTARFREVAISELVVAGSAPEDLVRDAASPDVRVGTASTAADPGMLGPVLEGAPYSAIADLCAAHVAVSGPQLARAQAAQPDHIHLVEMTPSCGSLDVRVCSKSFGAGFEDVRALSLVEDAAYVDRLAVKTAAGWFPTTIELDRTHPGPGCGQAMVHEIETVEPVGAASGGPALAVTWVKRGAEWLVANPWEAAARFVVTCRLVSGSMRCDQAVVAAHLGDLDWVTRGHSDGSWPAAPPAWDWTRNVAPRDGLLRLGRCKDRHGKDTKCDPRAGRLVTMTR